MICCNSESQSQVLITASLWSFFDETRFIHLLTLTQQELACFAVNQLEDERPAGDDAGASGQKVPEEGEKVKRESEGGERTERERE